MISKKDIEKCINRNMSIREIAKEFKCSSGSVRYCLKKYNLKTRYTRRTWTDNQLREAVKSSISISEIVKKLGLSPTGAGNWRTVENRIKDLNIDTSHFLGMSWELNKERNKRSVRRHSLPEILISESKYPSSHLLGRLVNEGIKEYKCENCGVSTWMGKKLSLELHHINGNHSDNRLENLQILCPNCHALTPSWRRTKSSRKLQ